MTHHHRQHNPHHDGHQTRPERIPVDIEVTMTSVLTSASEAKLRDLTEYGALIEGPSLPKGTQFQIEYRGQTIYGFVVWAEHDRFGARFPFTLCEGPLHQRLEQARIDHELRKHGGHAPAIAIGLASRALPGFGRRGLN